MANRLLINILNVIEWLGNGASSDGSKESYKDVVYFLKQAMMALQPVVEALRGKDINTTDKIQDEDGLLVTLNDLIDHLDYIKNKDGVVMMTAVEKARFHLDLARQTIRLGSSKIPEIRKDLEHVINNVQLALKEENDNFNLETALVRLKGTMNDLENV